jgi:hypothetical protein
VTDSNRRRLMPADLQSAPVGHLGNRPLPFSLCKIAVLPRACRDAKPTTGVEPVTYRLQGGRSAIELRRHDKNAPLVRGALFQ